MALNVVMVTGPRRSGKSTLISALIDEICTSQPHYIRLAAMDGTKRPPVVARGAFQDGRVRDCGVATATWISYDPARVFETLPETLAAVQRRDRVGCVLIEADTDPNLRHAYPYDTQIFTIPSPQRVGDVFRSPSEMRIALQTALNDTCVFAGEVFGLNVENDGSVGGDGAISRDIGMDDSRAGIRRERPDMSDTQIANLMHSPLGEALASLIQFHPDYHGAIESDAVVINTGVGGMTEAVDEVVRRIEDLARRASRNVEERSIVFCCDLCDKEDPRRQKLMGHLARRYAAPDDAHA